MAVSFSRLSWWLWSGKEKESVLNESSSNSSISDCGFGLSDPAESVKFSSKNLAPRRKVKRKWLRREERKRVDEQRSDAVFVLPDDGICLSGLESDGPDWSIGWMEPHGHGFRSDDDNNVETDDGFAVLVPCYRPGCKELVEGSNNQLLSAIKYLPNGFSNGESMEWLSYFQKF